MKKLPGFLAGMLTATLIGTLSLTALASTGRLTLTADPINIQVNGEVFQPKSADGSDALVFAYNGVTYAPLRALAEAFGLEVGYDAEANMATVNEPGSGESEETYESITDYSNWTAEEESGYQEFKNLWDVEWSDTKQSAIAQTKDGLDPDTFLDFLTAHESSIEKWADRLVMELYSENKLLERNSFYVGFSTYGIVAWGGNYQDYSPEFIGVDNNFDLKRIIETVNEAIEKGKV